jgi:hypothetical protein
MRWVSWSQRHSFMPRRKLSMPRNLQLLLTIVLMLGAAVFAESTKEEAMKPGSDNREPQYCAVCQERGVTAIVFCDKCPGTSCIHLSSRVENEAWCVACLHKHGREPPMWSSWFWDKA